MPADATFSARLCLDPETEQRYVLLFDLAGTLLDISEPLDAGEELRARRGDLAGLAWLPESSLEWGQRRRWQIVATFPLD